MKIDLLTPAIKNCNLVLNIMVLLFGIFGICLLIGYLFLLETELFQEIYIQIGIAGLSFLLFGLGLSVIKSNLKKRKTFDFNENFKLEINSKNPLPLVNDRNDLSFSGNYLITDKMERYEIDNYVAFNLFNHEMIKNVETVKTKTRLFNSDPNKTIERIRRIISDGLFVAGHK